MTNAEINRKVAEILGWTLAHVEDYIMGTVTVWLNTDGEEMFARSVFAPATSLNYATYAVVQAGYSYIISGPFGNGEHAGEVVRRGRQSYAECRDEHPARALCLALIAAKEDAS